MSKRLVMLHPNWQSPEFRRSLRDKNGKVTETLVFQRDVPLELTDQQCLAVSADIGNALVLAYIEEREGLASRHRVDWDTTEDVRTEVAEVAGSGAKNPKIESLKKRPGPRKAKASEARTPTEDIEKKNDSEDAGSAE
jgi:hypothetical protein